MKKQCYENQLPRSVFQHANSALPLPPLAAVAADAACSLAAGQLRLPALFSLPAAQPNCTIMAHALNRCEARLVGTRTTGKLIGTRTALSNARLQWARYAPHAAERKADAVDR